MSEGMFTLEISKELCRDHQTIKFVENITELRTRTKGKYLKNLLLSDRRKLKRVVAKQPLLISTQIFENAGIEGVKKGQKV